MIRWWTPVLAIAAGAGSLPAQSRFAPLDSAFRRVGESGAAPAVGIAIVYRDSVIYTNIAGFADLERRSLATRSTRFDWASIAKQFTAFGISQLVERGLLRTTDHVRQHVPELDLGGAMVTISQLLHHTSGLEDTDGLYAISGGRNGDPVTHSDMLRLIVRQQHLRFAPGTAHFYSNGGYTLLAEIVSRVTRSPFAAWSDSAIFAPLAMDGAGFLDDPLEMVPGRALPYRRNRGGGYELSTFDLYPGAGGLFASVPDMALWIRHLLRNDAPAARRLRERGTLRNGDTLGYAWGLGWGSYRGRRTLGHAGSGPATAAHLMMIPELGFGVVAAIAGDVDANPAALAFLAADLVLGSQLAPRDTAPVTGRRAVMITEEQMTTAPPESHGISVSPERIARYAGRYRLPDGEMAVIRARGETLEWAINGRLPYIPLFPLAGDRFVAVPWWDTFRFELPMQGPATSLIREPTPRSLHGASRPPAIAPRLADPRFTRETAVPYVGWYLSDELETVYRVVLDGDQLALVHARHGRLPLVPLEDDQFAITGGGLAGVRFAKQGARMIGMEIEARSWGVRVSLRRLEIEP